MRVEAYAHAKVDVKLKTHPVAHIVTSTAQTRDANRPRAWNATPIHAARLPVEQRSARHQTLLAPAELAFYGQSISSAWPSSRCLGSGPPRCRTALPERRAAGRGCALLWPRRHAAGARGLCSSHGRMAPRAPAAPRLTRVRRQDGVASRRSTPGHGPLLPRVRRAGAAAGATCAAYALAARRGSHLGPRVRPCHDRGHARA